MFLIYLCGEDDGNYGDPFQTPLCVGKTQEQCDIEIARLYAEQEHHNMLVTGIKELRVNFLMGDRTPHSPEIKKHKTYGHTAKKNITPELQAEYDEMMAHNRFETEAYKRLMKEHQERWLQCFDKWMLDNNHVLSPFIKRGEYYSGFRITREFTYKAEPIKFLGETK